MFGKKKSSIEKNKDKKPKKKLSIKGLVLSLILTIVLFFVLLTVETSILDDYAKEKRVFAKTDIPAGTELTSQNVETYFMEFETDAKLVQEKGVRTKQELAGYVTTRNIEKNEAATTASSFAVSKDSLFLGMDKPVEIGFKADDISQVVGGTLRNGDRIDVNVVNKETQINETIIEGAYVSKAFDTSGNYVDKAGVTPTTVITVIMDEKNIPEFNEKLGSGLIRVSKTENVY